MVDRSFLADIFPAFEPTRERAQRLLFEEVGWMPTALEDNPLQQPLPPPGEKPPAQQQGDQSPSRNEIPVSPSDGFLPGEPQPPQALRRFIGGYYVKRASSAWEQWAGIEGTVTIGTPTVGESRISDTGRRLDGFSIYVGGNADGRGEIDAGLSWDYVQNADGVIDRKTYGWRPFFRNGTWNWCNKGDVYWKPGETVNITLNVVAPGRLRMRIADPGEDPKRVVEVEFRAAGWNQGSALQFKRVNSIDQVNNEGRPAQRTESKVVGSQWLNTNLLHRNGAELARVPMHARRQARLDMPPAHSIIETSEDQRAVGAEKIDIYGSQIELRQKQQEPKPPEPMQPSPMPVEPTTSPPLSNPADLPTVRRDR